MNQDDPLLEKLSAAAERYREAKRLMDAAFADCVEHGYPYSVIGEAMGRSKQEVHRLKVVRGLEKRTGAWRMCPAMAEKPCVRWRV